MNTDEINLNQIQYLIGMWIYTIKINFTANCSALRNMGYTACSHNLWFFSCLNKRVNNQNLFVLSEHYITIIDISEILYHNENNFFYIEFKITFEF